MNEPIVARMEADHAPELAIRTFLYYYDQLCSGRTGMIDPATIEPLTEALDVEQLDDCTAGGQDALQRTVMIKLNGGLGTSMGLQKAKSLLPAKAGLSFLDIIARQVLRMRKKMACDLPLIFMNSFNTATDTEQALAAYPELAAGQSGIPLGFLQHRVPKILIGSLTPVCWPDDPDKEWCPPGHGDIYTAMVTSGLLECLLDKGYAYAFISNADNLGAALDPHILGYFAERGFPFMMETADRTEADKKGGHVAMRKGGGLLLREAAQCTEQEMADFQDVGRNKYFNTNNLWINLQALAEKLADNDNIMGLPLIRNTKTVNPRDKTTPKVYQLETAMGAALSVFDHASVLRVPRTRFAPVKTTNDLLALWSDCYILDDDQQVAPNPARNLGHIVIKLDPEYYKLIHHFQERFPHGAPSLIGCESLTVQGDVRFGADVKLTGPVVICSKGEGQKIVE